VVDRPTRWAAPASEVGPNPMGRRVGSSARYASWQRQRVRQGPTRQVLTGAARHNPTTRRSMWGMSSRRTTIPR
jgi:hypothetical protein